MKPSLVLVGVANVGVRAASSSTAEKTLTWPLPASSGAPIATLEPLLDSATEKPELSPAASPSMSSPTWVQLDPL